jgi:CheY-like chemotaxis protein
VADSGQAALDLWQGQGGRVDILLSDVVMPHMSGGELARKLREKQPGLKVLLMSGYTNDMIERQGIVGGEMQLMAKPFTAEQLGRRLRSVLDS